MFEGPSHWVGQPWVSHLFSLLDSGWCWFHSVIVLPFAACAFFFGVAALLSFGVVLIVCEVAAQVGCSLPIGFYRQHSFPILELECSFAQQWALNLPVASCSHFLKEMAAFAEIAMVYRIAGDAGLNSLMEVPCSLTVGGRSADNKWRQGRGSDIEQLTDEDPNQLDSTIDRDSMLLGCCGQMKLSILFCSGLANTHSAC